MQVQLYRYYPRTGWDTQPDPGFDSNNTLLLFFTGLRDKELSGPLEDLKSSYPKAVLAGCTTAGEIYDKKLILNSLLVAVVMFESTDLKLATRSHGTTSDSYDAGLKIAEALDSDDLQAVFVLSEGLNVNGSRLIDGLNAVFGSRVVITGGLAGDGDRFVETRIMTRDAQQGICICAIGFYGDSINVSHGTGGGWSLLGFEKEVTRSEGNVLFELDGRPALAVYKKYLGERAAGLPSTGLLFPLALRAGDDGEEIRVRTILAVDEEQQSITFAGDIPQGGRVQLMHASMDRLIEGAAQAASRVQPADPGSDSLLCIAVSCVGRRLVLGQRTEEEIESVLEQFPPGTRQIGYYSYGEISPRASGECELHNQTMTLTVLQER